MMHNTLPADDLKINFKLTRNREEIVSTHTHDFS